MSQIRNFYSFSKKQKKHHSCVHIKFSKNNHGRLFGEGIRIAEAGSMSLARSFRRTGPVHYLLAAVVGVVSGVYIFDKPLHDAAVAQEKKAEEKKQG
ncbi:hypothetical protein M9434_004652 [Picochlorum sp. BPE23]|nr:hypothetical protein M9434_004652 [Picochlorum sp. BPE23]